MSFVIHEWVMSLTPRASFCSGLLLYAHIHNESCHIWASRVTYERVMSHMNESCHIWTRHVPYKRVMSRMNGSCHVWMSHVTYEYVISRINEARKIWMSHVLYERVTSHMDALCHTNAITYTYISLLFCTYTRGLLRSCRALLHVWIGLFCMYE